MASLTDILGTDIAHQGDLLKSTTGDLDTLSGLDNVREALFHRLVTSPGSLVHRPDYGVGIKDYQNAPGSLTVFQKLAARVNDQFMQDTRVQEVSGVRIATDDNNPNQITLVVRVKIVGYDETALQFTPFGEGA